MTMAGTANANGGPTVATLEKEGQAFYGNVALTDCKTLHDKRGDPYVRGTLSDPTGRIPFKRWNTEGIEPGAYEVTGKLDIWNGSREVQLSTLKPLPDVDAEELMPSVYDASLPERVEEWRKSLPIRPRALIQLLLTGGPAAKDPSVDPLAADLTPGFTREVASVTHHDAAPRGLLAHSYKTGVAAQRMMASTMYDWAGAGVDTDLVVAGAFMHDIGKVIEYSHGTVSHVGSLVSHRTLAVGRAALLHDSIVQVLGTRTGPDGAPLRDDQGAIVTDAAAGEEGYVRLCAIFAQHHGEWEENVRCVEAWLVHLADDLEARLTETSEAFHQSGDSHKVGGRWLA